MGIKSYTKNLIYFIAKHPTTQLRQLQVLLFVILQTYSVIIKIIIIINSPAMNLTLIFIVLSIAIGYMLYDTFKKSKQTLPAQSQPVASKIKTNYADECKILKDLHQNKLNSLRHRSISIHLDQQKGLEPQNVTQKHKQTLKSVITCLNKTTKIYVLVNKKVPQTILQKQLAKQIPAEQMIPYNSVEGAVAILRQLSCNIHLESEQKLLKIIKQYIPNIWYAGRDEDGCAKYNFKNQFEMVNCLQKLIEAYDLRKENKNQ